jgi:hypothetical protein
MVDKSRSCALKGRVRIFNDIERINAGRMRSTSILSVVISILKQKIVFVFTFS